MVSQGKTWTTSSECGRLLELDPAHPSGCSTVNEKRLGRIIRAKYDTDYFIIDKFPMALRPFYTMPYPEDPVCTSSPDPFLASFPQH